MTRYVAHAFKNIFNYRDRANRSEFWFYSIVLGILYVVLYAIVFFFFYLYYKADLQGTRLDSYGLEFVNNQVMSVAGTYLGSLAAIFSCGVFVRRLHDLDMSEWLVLLYLVPLVGGVFWLVVGCLPGKPYPNKYGDHAWLPMPVFPYPTQPGFGPPPQFGAQPPQYGAPPPQYVAPPPQYGAQPPQYGAPPPQYGVQPPQHGAQPPQHGGQAMQYGGPSPQYVGPPPQGAGQPMGFGGPAQQGGPQAPGQGAPWPPQPAKGGEPPKPEDPALGKPAAGPSLDKPS